MTETEPQTARSGPLCAAIWNGCECVRSPHDGDGHIWRNTLDGELVDPAQYPSRARSGLDAGLLARALYETEDADEPHDWTYASGFAIDMFTRWAERALASSGEAAPVDGLRASLENDVLPWLDRDRGVTRDDVVKRLRKVLAWTALAREEANDGR